MMIARDAEKAYRRAFDEFARWVEEVQFLTANPNPDRDRITFALFELEKARHEYNLSRDEWAQQLLGTTRVRTTRVQLSRDTYPSAQQDQDEDRLCAARSR